MCLFARDVKAIWEQYLGIGARFKVERKSSILLGDAMAAAKAEIPACVFVQSARLRLEPAQFDTRCRHSFA